MFLLIFYSDTYKIAYKTTYKIAYKTTCKIAYKNTYKIAYKNTYKTTCFSHVAKYELECPEKYLSKDLE